MKILVIGCGSIGERHIRNLKSIQAGEISAYDVNLERLSTVTKKYGVARYTKLTEALGEGVDAVIVSTPPSFHIPIASAAVDKNAHVFIEKPMSHALHGVDELIQKASRRKLALFIGYNFRFHSGLMLVKKMIDKGKIGRVLSARAEFGQYLPDWRPWQDYRRSYTAKRELGGGIILDGSHEIDYLRWLIGEVSEVSCFAEKISDLEVETEDVAGILLKFKNGAIAQIHLDFVRRDYSRECEIIGENGTVIWSYQDKFVRVYSAKSRRWQHFDTGDDLNDMYIQEMKHFTRCVSGKEKPLIDGTEGKRVLEIALAAKKSAETAEAVKI